MIGGSLGVRGSSNGSSHHKGKLPSGIARKSSSKTLLQSSRERERVFLVIRRCFGRAEVAMLLLVALALLVIIGGTFSVTKESTSKRPNDLLTYTITSTNRSPSPALSAPLSTIHRHRMAVSATGHDFCKNFPVFSPPPPSRRLLGPRPCPVCYIPVELAMDNMPSHPATSPVLRNLTYVVDENPAKYEPHGGSDFGGYPSLKERNDSFDIRESMIVHCGFVKGSTPGHNTEFDIDEVDLKELEQFHDIIVASAIFGNYDQVQQPINISEAAKENIPFYMFIDELTESHMRNSSVLDDSKRVGLWRIIVVRNVPYSDARRNGKVPKLLLHRIVPNVRYSIWIDGKLQLVVDPYQVLERFLWRENATLAISRHYKRFDVFEEAEANKAAKKYDNDSIDYQIDFYRREGLTPYTRKKLPITSDVPEGCVIVKEHIPVTNLFSCLWFNEVDRFTSRDQLSFSTVRDKLMAKVGWSLHMFQDCERRNFVIQNYHKGEGPRPPPLIIPRPPPAPRRDSSASRTPVRSSPRRGKRRHRKVVAGSRGTM